MKLHIHASKIRHSEYNETTRVQSESIRVRQELTRVQREYQTSLDEANKENIAEQNPGLASRWCFFLKNTFERLTRLHLLKV